MQLFFSIRGLKGDRIYTIVSLLLNYIIDYIMNIVYYV